MSRLMSGTSNVEALRELLTGKVLILSHQNADPDAIGSAYALKELLHALKPNISAEIFFPGGATLLSKRIMGELGISVLKEASVGDYALLLLCDTATTGQLESWKDLYASTEIPKIVIDHHTPHPDLTGSSSLMIVDEASSSTCELVCELFDEAGVKPSQTAARALLIGIVFDSKHLRLATTRTIRCVSQLLEMGCSLDEAYEMLATARTRSESIARLKGAQRMRLHKVADWTIATSQLSSYQSSTARALITLGSDVAIVAGKEGETLKASLRSSERFHAETSIHLGRDVSMALGDEFQGAGSGHPTAAGFNGEGSPKEFLRRAVQIVSDLLA